MLKITNYFLILAAFCKLEGIGIREDIKDMGSFI